MRDLLQPLDNGQIAPLLFLWAQRLVDRSRRLFGDAACGSLLSCAAWPACSSSGGSLAMCSDRAAYPALLAVGVFAVSVHPIRHAAEAKPYASDLLMALAPAVPAARWLRGRQASGWLWVLRPWRPWRCLLSNPAVFVGRGRRAGPACSRRGKHGDGRAGWPGQLWPGLHRGVRRAIHDDRPGAECRGDGRAAAVLGNVISSSGAAVAAAWLAGLGAYGQHVRLPGGGREEQARQRLSLSRLARCVWLGGARERSSDA